MLVTVTFDFTSIPAEGKKGIIVRVKPQDRDDILAAANMLGLRQSQFTRFACVVLARTILEQTEHEVPEVVKPKVFNDLPPGVME